MSAAAMADAGDVMQFLGAGEIARPPQLEELRALQILLGITTAFCSTKAEVNDFLRANRAMVAQLQAKLPKTYACYVECVSAYRASLPETAAATEDEAAE